MVGVAAVRVRRRRPVVAVVAGAVEQVAGILLDVAAPQSHKNYFAITTENFTEKKPLFIYISHNSRRFKSVAGLRFERASRSPRQELIQAGKTQGAASFL